MTDVISDDEGIDHKLPSPEEQLQVVALKYVAFQKFTLLTYLSVIVIKLKRTAPPCRYSTKLCFRFPAEIVAVDVSGRSFDRMSVQRRSLMPTDTSCKEETTAGVRRRTRSRKPRSRRRNTLAGTDQKEIRDALSAGYLILFLLFTEFL